MHAATPCNAISNYRNYGYEGMVIYNANREMMPPTTAKRVMRDTLSTEEAAPLWDGAAGWTEDSLAN